MPIRNFKEIEIYLDTNTTYKYIMYDVCICKCMMLYNYSVSMRLGMVFFHNSFFIVSVIVCIFIIDLPNIPYKLDEIVYSKQVIKGD